MKKLNLTLLLGLLLTVCLSSCKKDKIEEEPVLENPGPNVSAKPAVLELGNNVSAKFFARIIDENNIAVENATVKVGNRTAVTDENGIAIISNASVPEKLAYLTVEKFGYFLGSRSVIPQVSDINEIKIMLLKRDVIATINSGESATVSTPTGLTIDFEGEYVKTDGSIYEGSVNVSIKHIDPSSADFSEQMPGALFAQNESNNSGVLESYGMGAIEIFTASGEELQIASGSKATLHMPVTGSQLSGAPATIPLWHFDEIAGYWIEEGQATLINGEYVGAVKHFSFWNCDVFLDDAVINGSIIDASGNPVLYGSVEIITPNASTIGQVSGSGNFVSYVPANVSVTFNVFDDCGNQVGTWTNTFATNSTINHNFVVSTGSQNTLTGTLVDCNNSPVSNGYVSISIGNNIYFPSVVNGVFTLNLGSCITNSSFTVVGHNYTAIQTTGSLSYNTTNPSTNIGNIVACTAPAEYITYTVDNDPAITFFSPLSCFEYQDTSTQGMTQLAIQGSFGNNYCYVVIEGTTVGTYNFLDYSSSTPGAWVNLSGNVNTSGGYPNISVNLNTHGAVGTYTDVTFSGTYLDQSNLSHTVSGTIHVLRDS